MLLGRDLERAVLDGLLNGVRAGRGGILLMSGEAGVGKTELLEYAIGSAPDLTVVRAAGVESEMEQAFGALHQLCAPMLDRLERLPDPQRDALATVFVQGASRLPDLFLVGVAVLRLFSEAALERPLLCVVDDAQWVDRASAQILAFVGRRLMAESVLVVFAARTAGEKFLGLPELEVEGLRHRDARTLLASVVRGPLDERVAERIVAETHGNPLALLELPRRLSKAQPAGGFGLPDTSSLPGQIEERFLRRVEALPRSTRLLLLIAAAEPVGDPALLWRAAARLGIPGHALEPAQTAGLLEIGGRVRFRHPLTRSAAYRAGTPSDRRTVHRALAHVTDPVQDPDRRAWHRAQGAAGRDEDVAAELERSTGRAKERGGAAAAAAFLDRAVALTPDPAHRAQRALAAAHAQLQAGGHDAAVGLLVEAEAGPLDALQGVRTHLLRAQLASIAGRGGEAAPLLLKAAKQFEPLDVGLARETYLDALSAAMVAGRLAGPGDRTVEAAQAARRGPPPQQPPRAEDLLLDGLVALFTEGYASAVPSLQRGLDAFGNELCAAKTFRWLWLASCAAMHLWDDKRWHMLANRHVQLARDAGALSELPLALSSRIYLHLFAGELAAAGSLINEMQVATEAIGSSVAPYGRLGLAALHGREADGCALIEASLEEVLRRGEGIGIAVTAWASATLYTGLGRYDEALLAAERASEWPEDLGISNWGLADVILNAVRSGKRDLAADALERLSRMTRASGTDWALGIEARSRALLSEGEVAERLYREAIERLARTRIRVELARARLHYGEWLRRERRRVDAREQLRQAHHAFVAMGAEAFAERARRELLATGEKVRKRLDETRDELTPQEERIARLARQGLTNPEIGAQLFISPRTVEWHLRKVFTKLGISARKDLYDALPGAESEAV